jgi:hypothetical protein
MKPAHRSEDVDALLRLLHQLDELKPMGLRHVHSPMEALLHRAGAYLLWAALGSFGMLCLLAVLHGALGLSASLRNGAAALGMAALLFAAGMLAAQVLSSLPLLASTRRFALRAQQWEYLHDATNAWRLDNFSLSALRTADLWLAAKMRRLEMRLGLLFGALDKLVLLAWAATGWAAWREINTGTAPLSSTPWQMGFALLGALTLGGLIARMLMHRLAYQRDVLALAARMRGPKEAAVAGW